MWNHKDLKSLALIKVFMLQNASNLVKIKCKFSDRIGIFLWKSSIW